MSKERRQAKVSVALAQPVLDTSVSYWNCACMTVKVVGKDCDSPMTAWNKLVDSPENAVRWRVMDSAPALSPPSTTCFGSPPN